MKRYPIAMILLLTAALAAGCAKKPVQSAPVPPTTTTTPPSTTPVPSPPPAEPAPTTGGEPVAISDLHTAYFAYDSYTLDDAARAVLDQNARLLREHATWTVNLDGHCDERGTPEYNQALGQKRAEAVAQYLADAGIAAARLRAVSYGSERPADEGHDEAAWAKNRRVEFTKP
jgi:peptidoglycan-associated lipoprotein